MLKKRQLKRNIFQSRGPTAIGRYVRLNIHFEVAKKIIEKTNNSSCNVSHHSDVLQP